MQMKPPKSTVLRKQETVQVVETAKVDPTPVVAKVKKEKMLGSWKDGKVLFPPFFSKWFVVLFWFVFFFVFFVVVLFVFCFVWFGLLVCLLYLGFDLEKIVHLQDIQKLKLISFFMTKE